MFSVLRNTALAVIAAGLCLAASANAAPITYDITFTNTIGSTTPTGSFTYDGATQTFSNFIVDFGSQALDFTGAANTQFVTQGACPGTPSNAAGSFAVMSGTTTCATNQVWDFLDGNDVFFASNGVLTANTSTMILSAYVLLNGPFISSNDGGTFTIAAVTSAPEPMTATLLLPPLVGLLVARRRSARVLRWHRPD